MDNNEREGRTEVERDSQQFHDAFEGSHREGCARPAPETPSLTASTGTEQIESGQLSYRHAQR
jgi:hypothetical protein